MTPIDGPSLQLAVPHAAFEGTPATAAPQDASGAAMFEDLMKNVVTNANDQIHEAEKVGKEFAAGTRDDIHGTMLALSKADIELRMVGNIRNRVVDAFYEVWRMQI
ncbi:MAG TPA: flagellar hook-basal body complex protein FliE [Polyangiaceae bacterium]|jgi:flagellar hook-basal body complex protein FliE